MVFVDQYLLYIWSFSLLISDTLYKSFTEVTLLHFLLSESSIISIL
jgi:hypothetical protein